MIVGLRGINIDNSAHGQGATVAQSRGGVNHASHSTSDGTDYTSMPQVTVLGDSPTDYVAAGTRSGDFMGVPKTKSSTQGINDTNTIPQTLVIQICGKRNPSSNLF